eukprot:m.173469 g.173469  ORF g.173469 m.173469 type:complete len:769 (-) comp18300_c0_seq1:176-2482(-)
MAPKRSYDDALLDIGDNELNFDDGLFSNKKLCENNDVGFDLTTYLISDSTLADAVVPSVQALEEEVISGALNPWLSPAHIHDDGGESSPASPAFEEYSDYLSDDTDGDFSSLFSSPSHILSTDFDASIFEAAFDDTIDDVLEDPLSFPEAEDDSMPETMVLSSGASILLPKGTKASTTGAAARSNTPSPKSRSSSKSSSSKFKINAKIPFPSSLSTCSIPVPPPSSGRLPCTTIKSGSSSKKSSNSGSTLKQNHSAALGTAKLPTSQTSSSSLSSPGLSADPTLPGDQMLPGNNLRWAHNSTERKRRLEIRRLFSGLRDLFPEMLGDDKVSNINTLNRAIDNVAELNQKCVEQEVQLKTLRQRNSQLKSRLSQIRSGKSGDVSAVSLAPAAPTTVSKMTTGGVVVSLTSTIQAPSSAKSTSIVRRAGPPVPSLPRNSQTPRTPMVHQSTSKKFAPVVPKVLSPRASTKVSNLPPTTTTVPPKARAPNVPSAHPVTSSSRTATVSSIVARAAATNSATKTPVHSAPRNPSPKSQASAKVGLPRAPMSNTTSVQNARAAGSASAIRSAAMLSAAKKTPVPQCKPCSSTTATKPVMCMGKAPVVGLTRVPVIVSKAPVISCAPRPAAALANAASVSAATGNQDKPSGQPVVPVQHHTVPAKATTPPAVLPNALTVAPAANSMSSTSVPAAPKATVLPPAARVESNAVSKSPIVQQEQSTVCVEIPSVMDGAVDKKAVPAAIRQLMDHNSRGPQECKPLARRRPKAAPSVKV